MRRGQNTRGPRIATIAGTRLIEAIAATSRASTMAGAMSRKTPNRARQSVPKPAMVVAADAVIAPRLVFNARIMAFIDARPVPRYSL